MEYKYELHSHTAEASSCARSGGKEMARAYYEAGYTGVFVTNHFVHSRSSLVPSGLTWEEEIDWLMRGYQEECDEGKILGLDVFFAWEFPYEGADFLTYGLGKDWLLAHPEMLQWTFPEYSDRVHDAGGFIIQAHPLREAGYIEGILLYPKYTEAAEVFNGSHTEGAYDPIFNERAQKYAEDHNLIPIAGSDSHDVSLRKGSMLFDHRLESSQDLIQTIRCRKGYRMCKD